MVEALLLEPDLFDTYIAFDPSLWWNGAALVRLAAGRSVAAGRTVWLGSSGDGDADGHVRRLAEILAERAPPGAPVHYEAMPEESHAMIFQPAALRAFHMLFGPERTPSMRSR